MVFGFSPLHLYPWVDHTDPIDSIMASEQPLPTRQRRPSTSAPIVDIQGNVGPAGVSRPKHKRTFTGFGAGEIKNVEGKLSLPLSGQSIPPSMVLLELGLELRHAASHHRLTAG